MSEQRLRPQTTTDFQRLLEPPEVRWAVHALVGCFCGFEIHAPWLEQGVPDDGRRLVYVTWAHERLWREDGLGFVTDLERVKARLAPVNLILDEGGWTREETHDGDQVPIWPVARRT